MTVLKQSCALFCRNLRIFYLKINHKNLRICYLRNGTPKKLSDLRFRNEPKNFADLRFADFKKCLCLPLLLLQYQTSKISYRFYFAWGDKKTLSICHNKYFK
jgi:hypothetical protein